MNYDFIAIPDADVPQAVEPVFKHIVTIYASDGGASKKERRTTYQSDGCPCLPATR